MIRDPQVANVGNTVANLKNTVANVENFVANNTFTYKVGDIGPGGGRIFFVDRFNEHAGFTYLERRPDEDYGFPSWSAYSDLVEGGAYRKELGGGYQNTIDIVNAASVDDDSTNNAAIYCDTRTLGGKSDWYLPSYAEMKLIGEVDIDFGFNNFDGDYWTSTQKNSSEALIYQANKITTDLSYAKYIGLLVVFVRRF
jgi:hypothetical protein